MRMPQWTADRELATNMTPMIDVVFLLIIFFLVSSYLARQEARVPLDLPDAASHLPLEPDRMTMTVNVLPDGSWRVAGHAMTVEGLASVLADHHARHGETAAVRVRTDRTAPYARVEPILRASAEAGLWNASLAVYGEGR